MGHDKAGWIRWPIAKTCRYTEPGSTDVHFHDFAALGTVEEPADDYSKKARF